MNIVFAGSVAQNFRAGFEATCAVPVAVHSIADGDRDADRLLTGADVIIGTAWRDPVPDVPRLRLFHVSAAGYESIDFARLPAQAAVCNCFGHEPPIGEYVMAAILRHIHPLDTADHLLRQGRWRWCVHAPGETRDETYGRTMGILGFGHIGREVARKAKAFDLRVIACNRSAVDVGAHVDAYLPLAQRLEFYSTCDIIVVALPLVPETVGFLDAAAFAAMRPDTFLINVGRGPVIDEAALYAALRERRIAGAAIDTWYVYPSAERPTTLPANLPFHELDNLLMTPHLSGWTSGMIRRRMATMADNVARLADGRPLVNLVRPAA